jgi:hypothetical protein
MRRRPATLQIKVAQAILPYIRPKRSIRPIVADRHGFTVDRELARRLRNKVARISQLKRRRNPADQKLIVQLNLEMDQMTAALQCPCPSGYSTVHAWHDERRLELLWRKRRSRKKLNAMEDATLAHINARHMAFASGPEMQNRVRLAELKEKERRLRIRVWPAFDLPWAGAPLSPVDALPPKKADCDPEFLADCSAFSTVDADDDGYPLEYQRRGAPARGRRPPRRGVGAFRSGGNRRLRHKLRVHEAKIARRWRGTALLVAVKPNEVLDSRFQSLAFIAIQLSSRNLTCLPRESFRLGSLFPRPLRLTPHENV